MLFWLQACIKSEKNKMTSTKTNYSYAVTVTSPKEYPIMVHEGWLLDDKGEYICAMPKAGLTTGDWQYDGTEAGQGGSRIPYHLNLTYVAYAEKKFYTIDSPLPADKILETFRKGFMIKGDPDSNDVRHIGPASYDKLTIGAALGGVIVVWLSAGHHRIEVCRLQAKEVFVDKNDFIPHSDPAETQQQFFDTGFLYAVSEQTQQAIQKDGIPFGLWDKYREKYNYRFVLQPYNEVDKFTFQSHKYFNGEANLFYEQDLDKNEAIIAAIPKKVNLSFKEFNTGIIFDYDEVSTIFEECKKTNPNLPISIILKPTFMYKDIILSVKCGDKEIPLKVSKIEGVWRNLSK